MARPKGFNREGVLRKAIGVFWKKGYADTSLQDLERATGVNKSGLYSEFQGKDDLYTESLKFYLEQAQTDVLLSAQPLGLDNVERFLALGLRCAYGSPGCLLVNSLREVAVLPPAVETLIRENRRHLHSALARNLEAARPSGDAQELADLVLTFFSGLTLEQNLATDEKETQRKIASFMRLLRGTFESESKEH
ncbi:TetR/AcrR family transcriptional regulator [Cystobacter fuscus]